jgi:hypothetical protein
MFNQHRDALQRRRFAACALFSGAGMFGLTLTRRLDRLY